MKVYIWGTGRGFDKAVNSLNMQSVEVMGVIDNNPALFYKVFKNYMVYPVEEIKGEYDYIIVTVIDYRSILYQLSKLGILNEKIICYYDMNSWNRQNTNIFYKELWKIDILEEQISQLEKKSENRIRNLRYELASDFVEKKYKFPIIRSGKDATEKILNENKSLIRFGDGEFEIMAGKNRPVFQKYDEQLSQRLKQVISTSDDRILIAIADNYGTLDRYTDEVADAIREYMTDDVRAFHNTVLSFDRIYYDAYVFKCYYPYKDKAGTQARVQLVKKIWNKRNIVIIEGTETRAGVGNNLFDNAKNIKRILCPTQNAFSCYSDILEEALKLEKSVLILIILGPTGKVLAYDLVQAGYQVVDVGQIDMDYEWYLAGQGIRVPIANKYVSQLPPAIVKEVHDVTYEEQIISKIVC